MRKNLAKSLICLNMLRSDIYHILFFRCFNLLWQKERHIHPQSHQNIYKTNNHNNEKNINNDDKRENGF